MKDESKVNQRDVLIDEGKQADIEALGDCLRALADGQVLGDMSLTIVLYDRELTLPSLKANFEQRSTSGEFQNVTARKHETGRQFHSAHSLTAPWLRGNREKRSARNLVATLLKAC